MATKTSGPRKRTVAEMRAYIQQHGGTGANKQWTDRQVQAAIDYTARVYKTGSMKVILNVLYTH